MKSGPTDLRNLEPILPLIFSNENIGLEILSHEDQLIHQYMLKIMNRLPEPTWDLINFNLKLNYVQTCYSKAIEKTNQKIFLIDAGNNFSPSMLTIIPKDIVLKIADFFSLVVDKSFKEFNKGISHQGYQQAISFMEYRESQEKLKDLFIKED